MRRGAPGSTSLASRIAALDWDAIQADLDEFGYARTPPLLAAEECRRLIAMYTEDRNFRKRIDMEPLRFGRGDYAYFDRPLPALVAGLRTHLYRRLAPIGNAWQRALGQPEVFPASLGGFERLCHTAGQNRPTPLLLRYGPGGYNCLHQDRYGDVFFPLQATIFLSRRGIDYEGGEFLLVEQRPRQQSRGTAIAPERGEMLLFASGHRPVAGTRGTYRAALRHGVSTLARGSRYALGIIFHDAR